MKEELNFDELRDIYMQYFSLGKLSCNINEKFALISLLGYITQKAKQKHPDVTYYSIIKKIDDSLPEEYVKSLAIIVEDFSFNVKEFPTFGIKGPDMIKTVKSILNKYLPF